MNPCSPRFVYLFVALRILIRVVNFHNVKLQKKFIRANFTYR